MMSVEEALAQVRAAMAAVPPVAGEDVALTQAQGRVLAQDLAALATHPPADGSAMDGWALRSSDVASGPARLKRIGTAPAGAPFPGTVGPGEAVRIFTGGIMPAGADCVAIQENCQDLGDAVLVNESPAPGRHVRAAGVDFHQGQVMLRAGRVLTARDVGLAAAMNRPWLVVRRRPRVALLATGDEIIRPGEPAGPGAVYSANSYVLSGFIRAWGGEPTLLGVASDDPGSVRALAQAARGFDLLITSGGASVGDHDLVRPELESLGLKLNVWKVAMRPGKPLMFGFLGDMPLLGLPGNPVSAQVCALLFLRPIMLALQGLPPESTPLVALPAAAPLKANDGRRDHLRAHDVVLPDGRVGVAPLAIQDSAVLSGMAFADRLIIRAPHAPAAAVGDLVDTLPLRDPGALAPT